ncbi:jg27364, partial [Pararge aegeria aegeria]
RKARVSSEWSMYIVRLRLRRAGGARGARRRGVDCSTTARVSRKGSDPGAVIARRGRIPRPRPPLLGACASMNDARAGVR